MLFDILANRRGEQALLFTSRNRCSKLMPGISLRTISIGKEWNSSKGPTTRNGRTTKYTRFGGEPALQRQHLANHDDTKTC